MESYFGKIKGLQRTNLLKWDSITGGCHKFFTGHFSSFKLEYTWISRFHALCVVRCILHQGLVGRKMRMKLICPRTWVFKIRTTEQSPSDKSNFNEKIHVTSPTFCLQWYLSKVNFLDLQFLASVFHENKYMMTSYLHETLHFLTIDNWFETTGRMAPLLSSTTRATSLVDLDFRSAFYFRSGCIIGKGFSNCPEIVDNCVGKFGDVFVLKINLGFF